MNLIERITQKLSSKPHGRYSRKEEIEAIERASRALAERFEVTVLDQDLLRYSATVLTVIVAQINAAEEAGMNPPAVEEPPTPPDQDYTRPELDYSLLELCNRSD